jgi:transcriptional regulator with XRE-family HTH domain
LTWREVVGANIRRIRKKHGISQEQLAARVGINRGHLYKIEHARVGATLDMLAEIARALRVSPARLFRPPPTVNISAIERRAKKNDPR